MESKGHPAGHPHASHRLQQREGSKRAALSKSTRLGCPALSKHCPCTAAVQSLCRSVSAPCISAAQLVPCPHPCPPCTTPKLQRHMDCFSEAEALDRSSALQDQIPPHLGGHGLCIKHLQLGLPTGLIVDEGDEVAIVLPLPLPRHKEGLQVPVQSRHPPRQSFALQTMPLPSVHRGRQGRTLCQAMHNGLLLGVKSGQAETYLPAKPPCPILHQPCQCLGLVTSLHTQSSSFTRAGLRCGHLSGAGILKAVLMAVLLQQSMCAAKSSAAPPQPDGLWHRSDS